MKKLLTVFFIIAFNTSTIPKARADLFGGDVVVLTQILANALQQLIQLRKILQTGKKELENFQSLHSGINDALEDIFSIRGNHYKGTFKEWKELDIALEKLQKIYGKIDENSPLKDSQQQTDKMVAENLYRQNKSFDLSVALSRAAGNLKVQAGLASPKGAAKITAQGVGLMIDAMSEDMRLTTAQMKLNAQKAAQENALEKKRTQHLLDSQKNLKAKLQTRGSNFFLPTLK